MLSIGERMLVDDCEHLLKGSTERVFGLISEVKVHTINGSTKFGQLMLFFH